MVLRKETQSPPIEPGKKETGPMRATECPRKRTLPSDFFTPVSRKRALSVKDVDTVKSPRTTSASGTPFRSNHMANAMAIIACPAPKHGLSSCATPEHPSVPGLCVHSEFITRAEEINLLAYLDSCPWRNDLSRRTMHFGGTYCLYSKDRTVAPQIVQASPVPDAFSWLIQRFVDAGVYREIGDNVSPDYVIVNEYRNGHGISAHTENFSFHSPVLGLSLGSNDVMKFRELSEPFDGSVRSGKAGKAPRTGTVVEVELPGRSLCIMANESRWRWQHEITPRKRHAGFRRVSLTFRVKKQT